MRRSAQTAAYRLAETIAVALCPICPFTAEEIWEAIPGNAADPSALFLKSWDDLKLPEISSKEREAWGRVLALRADFLARLEPLRRDGRVGSAAQAAVEIGPSAALDADLALASLSEEKLAEVLGVPLVVRSTAARASEQSDLSGGLSLLVRPAEGTKCPRCWQVRADVEPDGICARCRGVVGE